MPMIRNKYSRIGKLISLSFIIFHLSFSPAGAQKLVINKTTIDVGKTGYEVPVTATFELRNKSSKQLVISRMDTDCGCTTIDGPRTVGAGQRFTISLTYDARMLGHFNKQLGIYSNASDKPLLLGLKGVVVEKIVDFSGEYPYSIGDVRIDNTDHDMTPNMLHLPSYLHALAMPEVLEPNRSGKIILTLNSEEVKQYGLTQVSIYLAKRLGEKISNETELPVSVVLLPDMKQFEGVNREQAPQLQLSADALNLDAHHKNGTIILTNSGKTALNITSLQMFTGGLKVKLPKSTLQPGESTKLRVTIIPSQIRKARSKPRILMITNDPEHAKVVININVE